MRLNYDALQELYDTLKYGPVLSSPYAESPIDRAFKECDEKLSESIAFDFLKRLQDRCDNLERSNKALRDDNDKLGNKVIELSHKNEELKKERHLKDKENADLSDRLAKLQKHHDYIDRCWTSQIQENIELKKQLGDTRKNVDGWRSRALAAEKRVGELLLKKYDQSFEDLKKRNGELERDRDFYFNKYQELKKYYDKLSEENRKLNARTYCLREEVKWHRMNYKRQSDKIIELKKEFEKDNEEMEKSRKCYRQLHVGEGARHLWDMLQNVNDSQPNEFDVECESMHDVIGMDLEDFLIAYKKWQEEKETDRMRNWLAYFCTDRDCKGCPLESVEYKCGCGYSFKKANQFDTRIIPDEDIKRYYEKARGEGDATFYFDNKPVTMEATVEVDKDLLEKVCGIKPKEEEHELEYGDAVRVPWKSYDYMYIGPEGKHIRLFDPKTHTVVVVSVRDNLTYQGCKIILCDEDDIRKIWKDKK